VKSTFPAGLFCLLDLAYVTFLYANGSLFVGFYDCSKFYNWIILLLVVSQAAVSSTAYLTHQISIQIHI